MEKNKKQEKKKHTLIKIFIFLIILIFTVCFYSKYYEVKHIVVKEYKINKENVPSSFDSVKIMHFSDVNYGLSIYNNELEKMVEIINSYKPEIVVFTGNLIYKSYDYSNEEIDFIISTLSKIDGNIGKYAVGGINDNRVEDYNIIMSNAGFKVLNNDYDLIYYKGYTPIYIGGLSSYLTSKIDLHETLSYFDAKEEEEEEPFKATYKIMLVNESDAVDEILSYDNSVDLILSGNTLGGEINIPFYGPLFKQEGSTKYTKRYTNINGSEIYVSNGIGTNKLGIRLFNYPSLNLYRFVLND